ncbi:MAG: flavodoxin [Symbiobacteriaceae bacterium]|jgi:menaquinone-dependent protoporphyrinogen oxidase|nr:flavodoxin [Symbiobacteriaceae bacterium]
MNGPILVTYATRTGSTVGVAEAIASELREYGLPAEVRPMHEVTAIDAYGAVVAGGPIQGHEWLPEAIQFLKSYQDALSRRPFATFTLCMAMAMDGADRYRQGVAEWLAPVRRLVRPVSEGLFAGVLDIKKVPSFGYRLAFRLAVAAGAWKEGDHRDWGAIRAWAKALARDLGRAPAQDAAPARRPALPPTEDHAV